MHRIALAMVAGLLVVAACSAGDDSRPVGSPDGSSETDASVADDPVTQFCIRWDEFAALMESDVEPTDELVDELLERQREIEEVLPDELSSAWTDIVGWNSAFVEYFSVAGYQEVTDEVLITVFGDEQAAEEAVDAIGAAFSTMHAWSARSCPIGEGDAVAFCASWTEISALLERLDQEQPTKELVDELFAAYSEAGPNVPAEIRDQWDALLAFAVPYRDVLETVEFDVNRVSDDLLAEAFGGLDAAEALEQAADVAEEAINVWSLEGCGGFCGRWGETREAIEALSQDLDWVLDMGEEGPRRLRTMQARLDRADQLLPEELRAEWDVMTVVLVDWFGWWESFDFERSRVDGPEGRAAAVELALGAAYFPDLAVENIDGPVGDRDDFMADILTRPDDVYNTWRAAVPNVLLARADRWDEWVDANCGLEGSRPGRLKVTWPTIEGAPGSTIVLAVMAPGATVEDLGNVDARHAGFCGSVDRDPWGYEVDGEGNRHPQVSEWFFAEPPEWDPEGNLCDFAWEYGPATLDGGPHTLLAALVPGGVQGRVLPAAATACLAFDIRIDGDTTLDLPSLRPCAADLSELVIDPEPWRTPEPVDPATPGAGTLRVEVPSLVLPEGIEAEWDGELTIIVLPAGTTLNEVGREQLWPSGGFRTSLPVSGNPYAQELARLGPVALPIIAVPPTGFFGWFDPRWIAEAPADQLPLTLLARGDYDVHAQISVHSPEHEDRRCGRTTVSIDGDLVVDMPELGECP